MKEIIYIVLSIVLGVFFNACNSKTDVVSEQDSNNWIVLNVEDAKVIDGNISLNLQLKTVVKYNLQIISKGELSSPLAEVKMAMFWKLHLDKN